MKAKYTGINNNFQISIWTCVLKYGTKHKDLWIGMETKIHFCQCQDTGQNYKFVGSIIIPWEILSFYMKDDTVCVAYVYSSIFQ